MADKMPATIKPARVRYIKLGEGGKWEKQCLRERQVRIGFGSVQPDIFELCQDGRWQDVTARFIKDGRNGGTATRFTNELKFFFEDQGETLWITFIGERLYWGMVDQSPAKQHLGMNGVTRRIRGGWRCTDITGSELTKDKLSGALTQLASYRGTSCKVRNQNYAIRRVNGQKMPQVEEALAASAKLQECVLRLIQLLGPRDFELLVDLVFSASGWRRLGVVGKTQKTLDIDLMLPSTGERAFVQVKSRTTSKELSEYVAKLEDVGPYTRMFYVFHSGEASTADDRVTLISPNKLAGMVLEAGLTNWLIEKVA